MNKQTKALKKVGMSSRNNGDHTVITPMNHGKFAFQEPAQAIERKKREGVRTWKISKRHPSHVDKTKNGKK